ncbi:hypothetical protein ARNL5_00928 [Anaerolineae bacterium]|nr:hypothetical protein ARNL5_00928 [Anaerolineae bacterium]
MRGADPTLILLFAKAPRPGHVKTRLAAAVGDEHACALYRAFLDDAIALARSVPGVTTELWAAGEEDAPALADAYPQLRCRVQARGDLGARMQHALADAIGRGGGALVIGTDLPTLPQSYLTRALAALEDVVIAPASDGGFWAIGARGRAPDLTGVRWSTPWAYEDTLARLRAQGREVRLGPRWHDVDEPCDLEQLRRDLSRDPSAAPCTRAALRALAVSFDRT